MVLLKQIPIPLLEIEAFCQRWSIEEFSLFGSVLRGDFHDDSDIDVLLRLSEDKTYSFLDFDTMQAELEQLFGRKVDIVDKQAIEESPNYIRRREILRTAERVYKN